MEQVAVSEFRANLMSFLKRVENGETLALTSRGREIARLVPSEDLDDKKKAAQTALRSLRKTAVIGDVLSPIETDWEAAQ